MDLLGIIAVIVLLIVIFVGTQTLALFFFLRENARIREEMEKNEPPF